MIKRLVKMEFKPHKIEEFKALFEANKFFIRHFEGCEHLELWQDVHNKSLFMTYSYWQSEHHLELYRHSDLFKKIWSQTKILFSAKPQAWSVDMIYDLK